MHASSPDQTQKWLQKIDSSQTFVPQGKTSNTTDWTASRQTIEGTAGEVEKLEDDNRNSGMLPQVLTIHSLTNCPVITGSLSLHHSVTIIYTHDWLTYSGCLMTTWLLASRVIRTLASLLIDTIVGTVGVSFAGVSTRYERIVLVQYSGLTIASGCVKHKIEIPTLGYDEKVKVCNDCHDVIRGAPEAAEN